MNKWIAIPLIIVLVAGCGAFGFLYMQKSGDLEDAESEISSLQSNVSSLQGNVSTLTTELSDSEATVATLETDYAAAQSEIATLESELSQAQGDYDTLKQKLDRAKLYGELLESLFLPLDYEATIAEGLELLAMIADLDDAEVDQKWAAVFDNPTYENEWAFWMAVWDGLWEVLN